MTLVALAIAWAIGIVLARTVQVPPWSWGGAALAVALCLPLVWHKPRLRLACALACAALLGGGRCGLALQNSATSALAAYNDGAPLSVYGAVSAEPDERGSWTQLQVSATQIEQDGRVSPVAGRLVVRVSAWETFEYGDAVRVTGTLVTPPATDDFDYREYLASRGVHSLAQNARVDRLAGQYGNHLLRWMYRAKRGLRTTIERILPQPEAGLLSGILLGVGHSLPDDVELAFRRVGLTHIVVISGFNIALVLQAVMLVGSRLAHRWVVLVTSLAMVALYTLFVGFTAPVTRAALMGGLFVLAQLAGRRSHALTSLAAASVIMTAINPLDVWSVSFQLSFAATLALVLVEPVLARRLGGGLVQVLGRERAKAALRVVRDLFLTTLAAQLLTFPVIWYHFGELSTIALPANVLVLFLQPLIMTLGTVATVAGAVWLPAGRILALAVWPLLRYTTWVTGKLSRLPGAAVSLPKLGLAGLVLCYALLAAIVLGVRSPDWVRRLRERLKPRAAQGAVAVLALLAALVWVGGRSLPDGKLHIYFLDVGQGDAILLRSPGGRYVLVDGGPDPLQLTSQLGRILPFWQRRLDVVLVTHADQDHLGGLLTLLQRYQVDHVVQSPVLGSEGLAATWNQATAAAGVDVHVLERGGRIAVGETLVLDVLHPAPPYTGDENANSLVLRASMGNCRILLTGDIDAEVEEALLRSDQSLFATVLKVAHHGAATATSVEFLRGVQPQVAVISVGRDNHLGHPSAEVLERLQQSGCRVLRTDQEGTIELITDGDTLWVRTWGRPEGE